MPDVLAGPPEAKVDGLLAEVAPRVISWRRHLHTHPEVSFEERETARFIVAELRELGLEVEQPTPTSVMTTIEGGSAGPVIAARADTDALPIQEESGVSFASRNAGVMHACGHDGHVAALLGVAAVLAEIRAQLRGRVRLIFQHAEERPAGGAPELIAAGVLAEVDRIFGVHLWAPLPVGVIGLAKGPAMASTDYFEVELRGAGGHTGSPHEACDPVAASADVISGLERLVARRLDPMVPGVALVTRVRTGDALNVVPGEARLGGTIRALTPEARSILADGVEGLVERVAADHGLDCRLELELGAPPLINDAGAIATFEEAGRACSGEVEVRDIPPVLAGDDFGNYLEQIPGAYAFVGAGAPTTGGPFPHHHPGFVIEEGSLRIATELLVRAILSAGRDRSITGEHGVLSKPSKEKR
jgi:amidohydrolase